jgi:hypothetical protein
MISFLQNFGAQLPHKDTVSSPAGSSVCEVELLKRVGDYPRDLSSLGDEDLESYIAMCSLQMLAANKLGMKEERRRWWNEEARALRERHSRPELVARLERELGLS